MLRLVTFICIPLRTGERCFMTSTQQTQNASGNAGNLGVHLLLGSGEMKLIVDNPEQVMEEIRLRAEQVSSVLQGILSDSHGEPRWGLDE